MLRYFSGYIKIVLLVVLKEISGDNENLRDSSSGDHQYLYRILWQKVNTRISKVKSICPLGMETNEGEEWKNEGKEDRIRPEREIFFKNLKKPRGNS